jgi:hypothetical protein
MAIDVGRVVQAAIQAAAEEPSPQGKPEKKRHLPVGRAVLIGAGLMTAGRLIVSPKGRELLGSLQQRIADFDGYLEDEEPGDEIEGEGDEDLDDEDYEDDLEGEGDEDLDDEDYQDDPEGGDEEDDENGPPRSRRRASSTQRSRS